MIQSHLASIIVILSIGAVLVYNASILKNKHLFNFSIHQIIYQFTLPAIFAYLINSYSLSLMELPRIANPFLSDNLLVNLIFLSCLITYGGMTIHSISKALFQAGLKSAKSEVGQLNQYLHLTFSHNLIFCGTILLLLGLSLLELNHITSYSSAHLLWPIFRGVAVGLGIITAMVRYIRPDLSEDYPGRRWSDLKLVFVFSWIAFLLVFYVLQTTDASISHYQLLVPSMIGLSMINCLNLWLTLRHFNRRRLAKKLDQYR